MCANIGKLIKSSSIPYIAIGVIGIAFSSVGNANPQEKYRYHLEESQDKEFCSLVTQVFNRRFQTPWDKGWLEIAKTEPKIFGVPYDRVFDRLPGVVIMRAF